MAKQIGPHKITGTIDALCFYKLEGQYYVRRKSSLTRKRVKRDPVFKRTMEEANLFGRASHTAAMLKRGLSREERKKIPHGQLTARVKRLMLEGKTEPEIFNLLRPELEAVVVPPVVRPAEKQEEKPGFAEQVIYQALRNEMGRQEKRVRKDSAVKNPLPLVEVWMNSG